MEDSRKESRKDWIGPVALSGMIVYAVVRSIFAASAKPFWFDEICTWIIVHQPKSHSMLSCLRTGMDGQPPLFYVIEKAFLQLPLVPEVSLRICSISAFCFALVFLFKFMRRRSSEDISLVCLLSLFLTAVIWVYAVEARPYALTVAATAAAMVCYQRAESPRWIVLLAACLVLGECFHYYMIFVVACFGIAELVLVVRSRSIRSIRFGVWGAFAASAIPLVVAWPLISAVKKLYGAHFWSLPSIRNLFMTYGIALDTTKYGAVLGAMIVIPAFVVLLWRETWQDSPDSQDSRDPAGSPSAKSTPIYCERVLVFALAVLPAIECAATKVLGGGYTWRYALPLTLAIPVTMSFYLERFHDRNLQRIAVTVVGGLLIVLVGLREGYFWTHKVIHRPLAQFSASRLEDFLDRYAKHPAPVVIASGLEYLQVFHYATDSWRDRTLYLIDRDMALHFTESDSLETDLLAIRNCAAVNVPDLGSFVEQHPSFYVYEERPGDGYRWWPQALADRGYEVKRVADNKSRILYLVNSKDVAR